MPKVGALRRSFFLPRKRGLFMYTLSEEKERRYFSWVEVWRSEHKEKALELELAFYNCKVHAKLIEKDGIWILQVPWVHAELVKDLLEAHEIDAFDYPHEVKVGERWKSYDRYQTHKFRGRGSHMILVLGFVIFILLTLRMLYAIGLIG